MHTMEIGYFLDLTVRSPKPVVITGAMQPWTVIGLTRRPTSSTPIVTAAGDTGSGSVYCGSGAVFPAHSRPAPC